TAGSWGRNLRVLRGRPRPCLSRAHRAVSWRTARGLSRLGGGALCRITGIGAATCLAGDRQGADWPVVGAHLCRSHHAVVSLAFGVELRAVLAQRLVAGSRHSDVLGNLAPRATSRVVVMMRFLGRMPGGSLGHMHLLDANGSQRPGSLCLPTS